MIIGSGCAASALLVAALVAAVIDRPNACFRRAITAMDDGNIERLQYDLLVLRPHRDFESRAALLTGKLLLAEGRWNAALDALSLATNDSDTGARALVLQGEALYRTGQFLQAGEAWTRVAKHDPQNAEAARWLGIAYYDLGAMKEAAGCLLTTTRLTPDDAGAHRLLGLIWKELGNYAEAADSFRETLRLAPGQASAEEVRLELAECLHLLRKDDQALDVLAGCAAGSDALALRAKCEYGLGRIDAAWQFSTQALKLDQRNLEALLIQARICVERKQPRRAAPLLERAVKVSPTSMRPHYLLALLWKRLGRPGKASEEQRLADELSKLHEDYGQLAATAAVAPHDVGVRIDLGRMAARLHMARAAREWFRAAIYLDPQNQVAREELLKLLQPTRS